MAPNPTTSTTEVDTTLTAISSTGSMLTKYHNRLNYGCGGDGRTAGHDGKMRLGIGIADDDRKQLSTGSRVQVSDLMNCGPTGSGKSTNTRKIAELCDLNKFLGVSNMCIGMPTSQFYFDYHSHHLNLSGGYSHLRLVVIAKFLFVQYIFAVIQLNFSGDDWQWG